MARVNNQVDPDFIEMVKAGLKHWLKIAENIDDYDTKHIDAERQNLHRLITFGLGHKHTLPLAANLCLELFADSERKGFWVEWKSFVEIAISELKDASLDNLKFQLQNFLGQLQLLLEEFDCAEETLFKAKDLLEQTDHKLTLANVYASICNVKHEKRAFAEAKTYGELALEIFNELEDTRGQAHALNLLGMVSHRLKDYNTSCEYYESSIERWKYLNKAFWVARVTVNLVYCLTESGQFEQAELASQDALDILDGTRYELDKSAIHINRGFLYYRLKKWELAINEFHLANSRYIQKSPHIMYRSRISHNLASVLKEMGLYDEADGHIRQAIRLRRRSEQPLFLANSLKLLGEILCLVQANDEAIEVFNEVLLLAKPFPEDDLAKELLTAVSPLLQELQNNN